MQQREKRLTTSCHSVPSAAVFVMADFGVVGSISPVLIFFKSGLVIEIHIGSSVHGSRAPWRTPSTNVLLQRQCRSRLNSRQEIKEKNARNRINNKQCHNPYHQQRQTTHINQPPRITYIAIPLPIRRIRIMQVVILLNILRKQQQPFRRHNIILFRDCLRIHILIITARVGRRPRVLKEVKGVSATVPAQVRVRVIPAGAAIGNHRRRFGAIWTSTRTSHFSGWREEEF